MASVYGYMLNYRRVLTKIMYIHACSNAVLYEKLDRTNTHICADIAAKPKNRHTLQILCVLML